MRFAEQDGHKTRTLLKNQLEEMKCVPLAFSPLTALVFSVFNFRPTFFLRRLSSSTTAFKLSIVLASLLLRHVLWPLYKWLIGLTIRGASQYSSTLRLFPLTVLSHSIPKDRESRKKFIFHHLTPHSDKKKKKKTANFSDFTTWPAGFLSPSLQSLPL